MLLLAVELQHIIHVPDEIDVDSHLLNEVTMPPPGSRLVALVYDGIIFLCGRRYEGLCTSMSIAAEVVRLRLLH